MGFPVSCNPFLTSETGGCFTGYLSELVPEQHRMLILMPDSEFRAYISYSHQDEKFAAWFHRALESWKLPRKLAEELGTTNLRPVFRDRSDLRASPDLADSLGKALTNSDALIVVSSKKAADSHWVNEEIKTFRQEKGSGRIFTVICDDEPPTCFPAALLEDENGNKLEPIAADARPGHDGRNDALLKTIAALLDVRFDDLKRRELRRQYRNMTIAATVFALIAVLTIGLAITAYDARNDANRRREQAEDLISFMVGDLRTRLEAVGRLDVLDAVGDKSLSYFAALEDDELTPGTLLRRAQATRQIGEVRMSQGNMLEAQEAFMVSNNQAQQILGRHENPVEVQFELSQSHFYIGYVHYEQGEIEAAREQFEAYLQQATALLEQDPDNEGYLIEVSYAHSNLGSLELKANRMDRARSHFAATASIQKRQMDTYPDDIQPVKDYVETVSWLGEIAPDSFKALDYFLQEVELRQRIVAVEDDKIQQERLADALALLASQEMITGDIQGSRRHWSEAVALSSELARYDDENIRWARLKAYCQLGLIRMRTLVDDMDGLALTMDAVLSEFSEILTANPDSELSRLDYMQGLAQVARLQRLSGRPFSGPVEEARRLSAEGGYLEPSATTTSILAQLFLLSGDAYSASGNDDMARAEWQQGLTLMTNVFDGGDAPRHILRAMTEVSLLERLGKSAKTHTAMTRLTGSGFDAVQLNGLSSILIEGVSNR